MVRPDEMSASSAPSTRPLKHCETKLAQLIMGQGILRRSTRILRRRWRLPPAAQCITSGSGVVAEAAAECVRLLHQRLARKNLKNLPEVLLVLHVLRRLA